jgi:hypothetical protein
LALSADAAAALILHPRFQARLSPACQRALIQAKGGM